MKNKQTIVSLLAVIAVIAGSMYLFSGDRNEVCSADSGKDCQLAIAKKVDVAEFAGKVESGDYTVIDLRTPAETAAGKITASALEIDFYASDFDTKLSALDRNTSYLIYCRSGNRSGQTLKKMEALGFSEVYDLKGGINAWQASGREVVAGE